MPITQKVSDNLILLEPILRNLASALTRPELESLLGDALDDVYGVFDDVDD